MSVIDRWGLQRGPVGPIILGHVVGCWGSPRRCPELHLHPQQATRWPRPLRASTAPHRPPTPWPSGSAIVWVVARCRRSVNLYRPTVVADSRPWSAADGRPPYTCCGLACRDISPPFQGRGLSRPGVGLVVDLPIPGSASWRCPSLPPPPILGFAAVGRSFLGAGLPILGLASRRCPSLPPPPILGFAVVGRSFHIAGLPILGLASQHCPSLPLPPILGFIVVGRSFHWFLAAHPSSS